MAKSMSPEQAWQITEHQRRRFNELIDVFDTPQPAEVMARLQEICAIPLSVLSSHGNVAQFDLKW